MSTADGNNEESRSDINLVEYSARVAQPAWSASKAFEDIHTASRIINISNLVMLSKLQKLSHDLKSRLRGMLDLIPSSWLEVNLGQLKSIKSGFFKGFSVPPVVIAEHWIKSSITWFQLSEPYTSCKYNFNATFVPHYGPTSSSGIKILSAMWKHSLIACAAVFWSSSSGAASCQSQSSLLCRIRDACHSLMKSHWDFLKLNFSICSTSIKRGLIRFCCFVSVSADDKNTHSDDTYVAWISA